MTDHDDTLDDAPGGMDRRTLIKRGAIAGGALVWAAPVVTTLGSAGAQVIENGTPEPENGTDPVPETAISFIAFTARCNGTLIRSKVNIDEWFDNDPEACQTGTTFVTPFCETEDLDGDAGPCPVDQVVVNADETVTIHLNEGCEFKNGPDSAFVKCGTTCEGRNVTDGSESWTFAPCAS